MGGLGVSNEIIDSIICKAPVILKAGLGPDSARRYAEAVQSAGGRVTIQEHLYDVESTDRGGNLIPKSLQSFTRCQECGHKQLKKDSCIRCGSFLVLD